MFCFRSHHDVTAGFFKIGIIKSVGAITDAVLHHIFRAVSAPLRPNACHVHYLPQVDDKLLVEVARGGRPRICA